MAGVVGQYYDWYRNEAADQVDAGQAVGTASAPTGINTGVYFELRQNNKPVDPRSWLSRQR